MNVADQGVSPVVERCFPARLDRAAVRRRRERRVSSEPALRRRDGDDVATEDLGMIDGNSVNGVTLGHAGCDVTGTLGAS
jgi:hypothetical protein